MKSGMFENIRVAKKTCLSEMIQNIPVLLADKDYNNNTSWYKLFYMTWLPVIGEDACGL